MLLRDGPSSETHEKKVSEWHNRLKSPASVLCVWELNKPEFYRNGWILVSAAAAAVLNGWRSVCDEVIKFSKSWKHVISI